LIIVYLINGKRLCIRLDSAIFVIFMTYMM